MGYINHQIDNPVSAALADVIESVVVDLWERGLLKSIQISSTIYGEHKGQGHYTYRAVDINYINGIHIKKPKNDAERNSVEYKMTTIVQMAFLNSPNVCAVYGPNEKYNLERNEYEEWGRPYNAKTIDSVHGNHLHVEICEELF